MFTELGRVRKLAAGLVLIGLWLLPFMLLLLSPEEKAAGRLKVQLLSMAPQYELCGLCDQ